MKIKLKSSCNKIKIEDHNGNEKIYDLNSNIFRFSEIQFRLNNIPLESEMISVKNIKDDLFFEGILESKKIYQRMIF